MGTRGTASKMGKDQALEFAAAVVRQLPRNIDSTTIQGWIENQEALKHALHNALMAPPSQAWQKVWRTVNLGTGPKSGHDFINVLEKAGHRASDWATELLLSPSFTVADNRTEILVAKITTAQLGFPNGAEIRQIFQKFEELNLWLPAEVGPQTRLQYPDQPMGEWLLIAMKPIAVSVGDPDVFSVARDSDGSWLYGYCAHPEFFCHPDFYWLVAAPASGA